MKIGSSAVERAADLLRLNAVLLIRDTRVILERSNGYLTGAAI
jgi:hypothetical protein